jgi:hypothetical protein
LYAISIANLLSEVTPVIPFRNSMNGNTQEIFMAIHIQETNKGNIMPMLAATLFSHPISSRKIHV